MKYLIQFLLIFSLALINTATAQTYLMPVSGSDTISVCTGTLKDNGNNGNYSDNINSTLVIKPGVPGNYIKISCNSINMEACCDRLFIFSGIGTNMNNLIGVFTSTSTFTVISTDVTGALTLVFESDEVTVGAGFTANITCVPCFRPDLFLTNYSLGNTTVPNGQTVSTSTRVNNSNWTAQSSHIFYTLSTDQNRDTSDTYLAINTVNAVNAGSYQTVSTTLTIPENTIPGNYYVLFYADATDTINECSETNNLEALPLTVVQSEVDVMINNITVNSNPDYTGFFNNGEPFSGTVNVKNIGNTSFTGAGLVSMYFSKDSILSPEDKFINTITTTLYPGATVNCNFSYSPAYNIEPGNYYFIAKTDVNGNFAEPSETNNIDFFEFQVEQAYHDLEAVSLSNLPINFKFNTDYYLQCGIRNIGRYYTNYWFPFTYQIILSIDTIIDNNDVILISEETNSTVDINAVINYPETINLTNITFPSGPAYLILYTESTDLYVETNETNNQKNYPIVFPEINYDIAPTAITVNSQVPLGLSFTISSTVKNHGTHFFSGCNLNYYLSTDNILDAADYFLGTQSNNSNLIPDGTLNLSALNVTIPPMFSTGSYFILAYADPNDYLNEINETNNVFATPVTVSNFLPDLQVSTLSSSSIIYVNGENSINVGILNAGHNPASNFNVALYLSTDTILDGSDLQIYDQVFGNTIQAGNTYNLNYNDYSNNSNYPLGSGYIIAKLNRTNSMNEYSLLNNFSYFPVTVINGTYNIIASSLGNLSNVQQGNSINLSFKITNAGSAVLNYVDFGYYLSNDAIYDLSDVLIWNSSTSILMPSDYEYTPSINYTIPISTPPGTYYIIYYADRNNVYIESNETNNFVVDDFNVTAVPVPGSDLDIITSGTTVSHTIIGDSTLFAGNITIDNIGTIPASSSNCAVYLSSNTIYDSGDILLTTIASGIVNSSPNVNVPFTCYLPAGTPPGNYYLIYYVDYDSLVTETFETNNTIAKAITVVTSDNDVKMIPNTFPNDTILSNVSTTYTYWVKNFSNNGFYGGTVHYLLSADTIPDLSDFEIGNTALSLIDIGESPYKTVNLTIPASTPDGYYYFIYYVDMPDIYGETNEYNNYRVVQFYLKTPLPDLEVQDYLLITPVKVASGATSSSTFEGKIRNTGEISASSSQLRYYISTDTVPDVSDYILGTSSGTTLNVSASYSARNLNGLVYSSVSPGNYFLIQYADPDNLVAELDENNNIQFYSITIYPLYTDLITTHVTLDNDSIPVGRLLNIQSGVKNDGTKIPGSTHYFNYFLSTDTLFDAGDMQLYSGTISINLAPGSTSNINQNITIPNVAPGDYYILGFSDAFSAITEPDEINNIFHTSIKIAPQTFDFFHDIIGIVSDTLIPSETCQVMGELFNSGNNKPSSVAIHFYLSTDTLYNSGDVLLYNTNVTNLNFESSLSYYHSFGIATNLTSGNYYLLYMVDITNVFNEVDENNNVRFLPVYLENFEADLSILPNGVSSQNGFIPNVTGYQNYFTMRNTKNKNASNFNIRIHLSPDSSLATTPNYILELSPNLSLNGYSDVWDNLAIDIPVLPAGDYYMIYEIDYLNEISESNENNNTSILPVKIINDTVDILPYSMTAPVNAVEGTSFTINYSIRNKSAFAVLTERSFYLSADTIFDSNNDWLIAQSSVNAGTGISSTTANALLPTGLLTGFYYLILVTDEPGNISESDETNNSLLRPIYIENSVTINITQNSGQLLTMCEGTVYDYGDANYPYFNASNSVVTIVPQFSGNTVKIDFLYLVTESCCDKLRIFNGPDTLSPLIGSFTSNPGTIISTHNSGKLTLAMISDSANVASGFAANISCVIPGIDLTVENLIVNPDPINDNTSTTVEFDIANYGSTPSIATNAKIYLSTDTSYSTSDVLYGTVSIASLTAFDSDHYSYMITPNVTMTGMYYIIVIVDQDLLISEINENNNTAWEDLYINNADNSYDVSLGTCSVSSLNIIKNTTFDINVELINSFNTIGLHEFNTYISIDTNLTAGDLLLDNYTVSGINSASNFTFSRNILMPNVTPGMYYLLLFEDSNYDYIELNESNNLKYFYIEVLSASSIDEESNNPYSIHPNPANESFYILYSGNDNPQNQTIFIYDVSGKLIETVSGYSFTRGRSELINIKNFSNGVYYIKTGEENNNQLMKLIIAK